jgi:FemAB family protein
MIKAESGRASALPFGSPHWQQVLDEAWGVSVDYLPTYIAYQEAYHGAADCSQIFFNDGKPVAVLPLATKDGWITSNGTDIVPPLFVEGLPEKVRKRIVSQAIDEVQGRLQNDSWITREIAFGPLSLWHTRVLEAGALACPHTVELFVDLGLTDCDLWGQIRKSYRSLIRQAEKQYQVLVGVNIRPLQKLHLADAGRVTRSEETWDLQQAAIEAGEAFCVYVEDGGEVVAGALFHASRDEAYYAVAAENPAMHGKPFGHLIQWAAIRYMQERKLQWYHLGTRPYEGVSDKEMQIAHFKEGWATDRFPCVSALLMR